MPIRETKRRLYRTYKRSTIKTIEIFGKMLHLRLSLSGRIISINKEVFPTMREKSETLIRLPLKITFLSNIVKHFPRFIPFHQAAKLFPSSPIPVSETTHILSLKLKSIHRQSMQTLPFKHSQTLLFPLSRKVTPVLSDVPLLNSRAYVPSSTSSSSPSSSCTRRKTHERTRPSENRLAGCAYIRLQTLFQGVAECVGA